MMKSNNNQLIIRNIQSYLSCIDIHVLKLIDYSSKRRNILKQLICHYDNFNLLSYLSVKLTRKLGLINGQKLSAGYCTCNLARGSLLYVWYVLESRMWYLTFFASVNTDVSWHFYFCEIAMTFSAIDDRELTSKKLFSTFYNIYKTN